VNVGRFGPYVQLGKTYASIPKGEEPLDVTLERAIEILDAKAMAEANKMIKEFSVDVQVLNGRYGPYIKAHGANVRIPKGKKAEELTLEECLQLYEEQKDKPKGKAPRKGKK
jgi:DNA topoisomerase-1